MVKRMLTSSAYYTKWQQLLCKRMSDREGEKTLETSAVPPDPVLGKRLNLPVPPCTTVQQFINSSINPTHKKYFA